MTKDASRTAPLARWQLWLVGSALATLLGLLSFTYQYLDVFVRGRTEPVSEKLIEELTGAWGACLLGVLVIRLTRRLADTGLRAIGPHVVALIAYSAVHTTLNWGARTSAYALFGLGQYDYGIMRLRYLMEFPNDVILYILFVSFTMLFDRYRAARDNEVRLAELEAEMSRVRLQALEARLQPHFLFNALNTVSAVMYESVEEADRVLTRLAELLRRTLRHDAGAEITLAQEIETLELYLAVIRARFGDRLTVTVDIDDDARDGAVPPLLLQPLVENAVKHGDPGPGQPARVDVTARRVNGTLRIEVRDNGPGLSTTTEAALTAGIGLSTTGRRLQRHYGDGASLSLAQRDGGGLVTSVVLPFRALPKSSLAPS